VNCNSQVTEHPYLTKFSDIFHRDVRVVARPAPKSSKKGDKRYISRENVAFYRHSERSERARSGFAEARAKQVNGASVSGVYQRGYWNESAVLVVLAVSAVSAVLAVSAVSTKFNDSSRLEAQKPVKSRTIVEFGIKNTLFYTKLCVCSRHRRLLVAGTRTIVEFG
jgi:hypothetical protein